MERKNFAVVFGSESHVVEWDHDLVDFIETFLKGLSDDEFRTTVAALNESLSSFEDEDVLEGILATATKTMRMAADAYRSERNLKCVAA